MGLGRGPPGLGPLQGAAAHGQGLLDLAPGPQQGGGLEASAGRAARRAGLDQMPGAGHEIRPLAGVDPGQGGPVERLAPGRGDGLVDGLLVAGRGQARAGRSPHLVRPGHSPTTPTKPARSSSVGILAGLLVW
jgi:hypothetical protein